MNAWRLLRASVAELVSLVVDDVVTFLGAALGLVGMYLLAHNVAGLRTAAGFGMYALVWIALAVSFARDARRD
jgi:hypothetical protein